MTPPTATAEAPRARRTRKPSAAKGATKAAQATKVPAGETASRSLSTIDLTEELDVPQVAELVARGRENGELSLAELKETLDKADLGAELLPALVRRLGEAAQLAERGGPAVRRRRDAVEEGHGHGDPGEDGGGVGGQVAVLDHQRVDPGEPVEPRLDVLGLAGGVDDGRGSRGRCRGADQAGAPACP